MKWNEIILSKITNSILDISIVIDNDNILNDESILLEINKDNYEILEMNDLEEVRLAIEIRKASKYAKKLLIVSKKYKKEEIPYDFQRDWDVIDLKLQSLFDGLDYNVLKNIDSSLYGEIYEKFIKERQSFIGENNTLNFITKKIYDIDISSIDGEQKLISTLLKVYLNKKDIDKYIGSYLLNKVDEYISGDIPFNDLISDEKIFWSYVQEQWNLFINDKVNNTATSRIDFNDKDIIFKGCYASSDCNNLYAYTLLKELEESEGKENEVTLDKIFEDIKWQKGFGFEYDTALEVLDELNYMGIIKLNKQLNPITLIINKSSEDLILQLYDDLI